MTASVRLYELVLESGRSASPFVWRIRYALAHKGIAYQSVPLGFIEIPQFFEGRFKTLPIIENGDTVMAESWDIAEYLDRAFPEQPQLFSSPTERSMVRLFDQWFLPAVVRPLLPVLVLDVYNAARAVDRPYFRESREARFKCDSIWRSIPSLGAKRRTTRTTSRSGSSNGWRASRPCRCLLRTMKCCGVGSTAASIFIRSSSAAPGRGRSSNSDVRAFTGRDESSD